MDPLASNLFFPPRKIWPDATLRSSVRRRHRPVRVVSSVVGGRTCYRIGLPCQSTPINDASDPQKASLSNVYK
jgi:hypothetical protein